MAEDDLAVDPTLAGALARAQPPWMKDGLGLRGPQVPKIAPKEGDPTVHFPENPNRRSPRQPFFPETAAPSDDATAAQAVPKVAFILSDASTGAEKKLRVTDGKIKGEFPSGMGFGNYVLTIPDPSDGIVYALATFDPVTLALTSRSLGVSTAAAMPESRVDEDGGFLYWQIGFAYMDGESFKFLNTRVGDINFELAYGALNGKPALIPVESGPGWLDLEALFP